MVSDKLKNRIKQEEGLRLKPYLCPAGKLTIGYGHNIEDNGIPRVIADDLLVMDILSAQNELFKSFPDYRSLSQNRIDALVDMAFNMGMPALNKFRRMHQAIKDRDFDEAARQVLDSNYAKRDVPERARTNSDLIKNG